MRMKIVKRAKISRHWKYFRSTKMWLYSWSYLRSQHCSRSIWTVYMHLLPTPPRPICMSCAAMANSALGQTSPITALPFLHMHPLMRLQDIQVVVVYEGHPDSLWYAPCNCGDKSQGSRDTFVLRRDAWFDVCWWGHVSNALALKCSNTHSSRQHLFPSVGSNGMSTGLGGTIVLRGHLHGAFLSLLMVTFCCEVSREVRG